MKNKTVIVVGGTGFWGRRVIGELLKQGAKRIKVFARNEFQMVNLLQELQTPKVEMIIGDIRDHSALSKACKGCDILFHLAALKHVPVCEKMPFEAISTNILGTQNVIDCAVEAGLEKVIYVSTDKAVNANSTYGCTKLLGEKLILSAAEQGEPTKFVVFRSGNLLGSTGSVIPLFKRQIEEKGQVTITDEKMNRFFITIEKAATLLVDAANRGAGGEIFLPAMPSLYIKDIAQYLLVKNGLAKDAIRHIGIRPGERLEERLLSDNETKNIYKLNEELFLVCPKDEHSWAINGIMEKTSDYVYESDRAVLSSAQVQQFLDAAHI